MATERLYYSDSSLMDFEGEIIRKNESEGLFHYALDRSAFYPTSGGQPNDTGLLNNVQVTDVFEDTEGIVWHVTSEPIGEIGEKAHGQVDSERRSHFRRMHTAQHLLSALCLEMFNAETVSVHLGEEYGAIELSGGEIIRENLHGLEDAAIGLILSNLEVEVLSVHHEEIDRIPLRKKTNRKGTIRIVRIGEIDYSACGGTHCNSTLEISLIKIIGLDKQRGRQLLTFLSGSKAVDDYQERFDVTEELKRNLTCGLSELNERVRQLEKDKKKLQHSLSALENELIPFRVRELVQSARSFSEFRFTATEYTQFDYKTAALIARTAANELSGVAAILVESRLIVATCKSSKLSANTIVKHLSKHSDLKGGGSPELAQLGGVRPDKFSEFVTLLEEYLKDV